MRFAVVFTVALIFFAHPLFAQSWYTVDDFQYSPGKTAIATGLAKDPTGTIIYSAGYAADASGVWHALAFESLDGGTNWSLSDDYTGAPDSIRSTLYKAGIAADPFGNLYASGYGYSASGSNFWFTRSLAAGASTWVTVDLLATNGAPLALASDSAGEVYVVGGSGSIWLVRKGTPSSTGISWLNVDAFSSPNGSCGAAAVFCHPTAGVFVVGESPTAWTVRRSQDGGASWTTIDTFQLNSSRGNLPSGAGGVGADNAGNLYVVGTAEQKYQGRSPEYWIVRKSANPGALSPSWSTVDTFQLSAGYNAVARAFAPSADGSLFVAGWAIDGTGTLEWVVRKSAGAAGPWQTVDAFQYGSGSSWFFFSALGDKSGNVFVAGGARMSGIWHWLVRKN